MISVFTGLDPERLAGFITFQRDDYTLPRMAYLVEYILMIFQG